MHLYLGLNSWLCHWDTRKSKDQLWQPEAQSQTGIQPGAGQPHASTETTLTLTKPKMTKKMVNPNFSFAHIPAKPQN